MCPANVSAAWCPTCGTVTPAHVEHGTWGPHRRKLVCAQCGRFKQWLKKEESMSYNRVILVGIVHARGVEAKPHKERVLVGSALITTTDTSEGGRSFSTTHLVEGFGKTLEVMQRLQAGDTVLVEGKLATRREGENWRAYVLARQVTRMQAAPVGSLAEEAEGRGRACIS